MTRSAWRARVPDGATEHTLQRGLPSGSRRQSGVLVVWQLLQMVGASPDARGAGGPVEPSGVAVSLSAPGVGGVAFFSCRAAFLPTSGPLGTAELMARSAPSPAVSTRLELDWRESDGGSIDGRFEADFFLLGGAVDGADDDEALDDAIGRASDRLASGGVDAMWGESAGDE